MKPLVKFVPSMSAALSELTQESSIYSGLEAALFQFAKIADLIPDVVETAVLGIIKIEALGDDVPTAVSQLFHQTENMLTLYRHVLACNYVALTSAVVAQFNNAEYIPACLAARALVEHTAIACVRTRTLTDSIERLSRFRPSNVRRALQGRRDGLGEILRELLPVVEQLNWCFGAGRFNRDALKDHLKLMNIELPKGDPHRQIGVMDAVDALQWEEPLIPATVPRFYYELLCDYVHPNVGANIAYVDKQDVRQFQKIGSAQKTFVIFRETNIRPNSESIRLHLTELIYIPFRESVQLATVHLTSLAQQVFASQKFCRKLRELGITPIVE